MHIYTAGNEGEVRLLVKESIEKNTDTYCNDFLSPVFYYYMDIALL